MADSQVYMIIDYETYSEVDLKRCGAYEYSIHPSTEIICAAWRIGTRETLRTAKTQSCLPSQIHQLANAMRLADIVVAHNAYFENVITSGVLGVTIPPERWLCTASLAAALALPRNLEGAAKALKLAVQKDMDGRRLILKWCKPRKPSKNNPKTRHDDPGELARLVEYCKQDVDTTVELFMNVPLLTPSERRVWELDQKINLRGFAVDRPLINTALRLIDEETTAINFKTQELTFGALTSATQRDGVLGFIESEGVYLPDLRKKTVEDALAGDLVPPGPARQMLEYRQAISKTSTAKYQAFERRSRHDSRVRDILLYHAASTGRWGGLGVQPQNLKRPKLKQEDIDYILEVLSEGGE